MSDLISRQAAYDEIIWNSDNGLIDAKVAIEALRKLPSVEPERKTGKWILLDECANEGWYCDQCHKKVFRADFSNTMKKYKFCPNCGAKMEVEE